MRLASKFTALFRRRKLETEMSEELRLHLEQRIEENIAAGMTPEEARHAALRRFGGVEQVKETARAQRPLVWLEQFLQDVRYGARQLRHNPGFTLTAVATLALGIGGATAMFSVVNGVVLKPLPYDQAGQLVQVFETAAPGQQNIVSPGVFLDWHEHGTSFEGFAAYSSITMNFDSGGEPERIAGRRMSANGLQLLRARPVVGRLFASDEDQAGKDKVIVLAHQLWQRRFGGKRDIAGRTISINGESYTVIGVLPAGFLPFESEEFVVPFVLRPEWLDKRDRHFLRVIARLKPGVSLAQAQAELEAIRERTNALYPSWKSKWGTGLQALQDQLARDIKPALLVLLGGVALVLLIACTNVANLLLARATVRQKEMAVRAALGAGRARIVRQLLAESVLLSLLGALAGLAMAFWCVDVLRQVVSAMNVPRAHEVTLDLRVLGLALAGAVLTGLGFGLAPALQSARSRPTDALKEAGRGATKSGGRLRAGLIVGEVALALVLLVGAGLLLHSFVRVINEPPGFEPRNAVAMQLSLPETKYPHNPQRAAFYTRLLERIAALPGVEAAGVSSALGLKSPVPDIFFRIPGRANPPQPGYLADDIFCTPDFLRALGVPLRRGRWFDARDSTTPRVALISETMAREYFSGEDPIGHHVGGAETTNTWEIVGVTGDVRTQRMVQQFRPVVFRLISAQEAPRNSHLVVRATIPPGAVVAGVRQVLRELDPTLPLASVQTLEGVVAGAVADRRLTLVLIAIFAAVALVLAAIGLYGVIAYTVTQRAREFGIRLALGASGRDVLGLILRQGIVLTVCGVAIGVLGALSLGRLLSALLYQVKPTDPTTFAVVSLLLLAVALIAVWLPARRAARIDPAIALRAE